MFDDETVVPEGTPEEEVTPEVTEEVTEEPATTEEGEAAA